MIINGILSHNLFCFSDCIFRLAQLDALCVRGGFFFLSITGTGKPQAKSWRNIKKSLRKRQTGCAVVVAAAAEAKSLIRRLGTKSNAFHQQQSCVYHHQGNDRSPGNLTDSGINVIYIPLHASAMVFSNFASALFSSPPFLFN